MCNSKIIQIIPAPADLWSVHRGIEEGREYESWSRIVCLALVEDDNGDRYRSVLPMSLTVDGLVDFDYESRYDDFKSIAYATVEEAHRRGVAFDLAEEAKHVPPER